ncbi:MAG TPA: PIN domain-containing protein [Candidatus Bathyarchaeia archaeon]|nr:PIN domain-containing protein [Candidatus Bathyarchaeia archaeon]
MTLVYLDTSVWLSITLSNDRNHNKALQVLAKVRSGGYVAIISRHVLSEVLDVLRKQALTKTTIKNSLDANAHRRLVERQYRQFTATILGMQNVIVKDTTVATVEVLKETLRLQREIWGTLGKTNACPICNSLYGFVSYDGPFKDDAMHLVLADKVGCDSLISFDRDFQMLKRSTRYSHIVIQVL